MRLVEGGGGLFGGRGRRPGGGGDGGGDGVMFKLSSSVGIVAGLSRDMEMFSGRPPGIAMRYEFSCRDRILYGPMKGALSDGLMPPLRTRT